MNKLYTGGSQHNFSSRLENLTRHTNISNYNIPNKSLESYNLNVRFSKIQKLNFRFNYKIKKNVILSSTDINLHKLYSICFPLIYSLSTNLTHESKKKSKSMIFFANENLVFQLRDMYYNTNKYYNSPKLYRILVVKFIRDYILNFYQLYILSKYSIYLLTVNNNENYNFNDMPLENMYLESYSQTVFKKKENYMIENRKRIVYYSLLMKYCILGIDHILKKFQIIITENIKSQKYGKNKYEVNNSKENMYSYYKKVEKEQDEYFKQSALSKTFTKKQIPKYVKYNNKTYYEYFVKTSKK
jgi:hypothetical protein